MRRYLFLLTLLLLGGFPSPALSSGIESLEEIARAAAAQQPGLNNYQALLETDRVAEMIAKMTANLPPDAPRPQPPVLRKYWTRESGRVVVKADSMTAFPYMQEMVKRFSREFALELNGFFLPAHASAQRKALFALARAQQGENILGEERRLTVDLAFAAPTDLHRAFFADGLGLPQEGVTALACELDPVRKLLRRMEVTTRSNRFSAELRYETLEKETLLTEVRVTTQDGRVDERFVNFFAPFDGFNLPTRQVRTSNRDGQQEVFSVTFSDYRINGDLPAAIVRELQQP
ncbi:MAG: hypothetical protein A2091_08965 [Desulfuromonadales bacterium GWD2_61_12]|nr:MAG: hypothetical protein A2005_05060 [Desulfuromonadales bacterium GWC2_61_20]OGR33646.1 MAG: hypothetical protein A2091_08965 [Desulfuromonadales bacterium GWD2_61_12]HAD05009.1 hypothetical protein [Desulfuromonas sp.]HBT83744.1 hypothetical protein [Desulfuromonas sp.]